jgi:hypothetical protein
MTGPAVAPTLRPRPPLARGPDEVFAGRENPLVGLVRPELLPMRKGAGCRLGDTFFDPFGVHAPGGSGR